MSILKYFRSNKKTSASTAKERLQIIISHERAKQKNSNVLQLLQQDLINVIAKYFKVDQDTLSEQVKVDLEKDKDHSVLMLNMTLPDMENIIEPAELEEKAEEMA